MAPARRRRGRSSSATEPLLQRRHPGPQVLEGGLEAEPAALGLPEDEVDALHEVVDVGDELLLQDKVALVDLPHVVAVQPEDAVVMAVGGGEARLDLGGQLVVELDLAGG